MLSPLVQPLPIHRLYLDRTTAMLRSGTPGSGSRPGAATPQPSLCAATPCAPSIRLSGAASPLPPRASTPAMTPAPTGLTLAMYPDIADAILLSASYSTQTTLREVCRYFRDRVDTLHAQHIALRTAMCRSPLFKKSLSPAALIRCASASGVHLVVARPSHNVRHDTDKIYGYFYAGNCIPGLGYGLAFNTAVLSDPPARQKVLLKHTRVVDVYPNDIDWEFAVPRAQLEGAVSALDPSKVEVVRYAEEVDPWWYTRSLAPSLVIFDLRHFDAQRPEKHSTYSYSLASARIPPSATEVVIHVPVARWRFVSAPLDGFLAHPTTQSVTLVFRPVFELDEHAVKWEGQAPPMGVLHKFLQDNRALFPSLRLIIVGAENVNTRVFGRAFPDVPRPPTKGESQGGFKDQLLKAIQESAGTIGWSAEQAGTVGECMSILSLDEYRASLGDEEWDLHVQFPHYL